MKFIREVIGKRWIKVRVGIHFTEQTDRLENSTGRGVKCNPFPSGNQWYIRRTGKWSGRPLFSDDLAIYITRRSQRVASRALQGVTTKLGAWPACL